MSQQMEAIRQNVRDELDILLARIIIGGLDEIATRRGRAPSRGEVVRALVRKPPLSEAGPPPSLEGIVDRFRHDDIRCMLEILEERGLVEPVDEARRLAVTVEGKQYLRG